MKKGWLRAQPEEATEGRKKGEVTLFQRVTKQTVRHKARGNVGDGHEGETGQQESVASQHW